MVGESEKQDELWRSRTYPVREDIGFQRRTWLVERVGWVLFALLAAAALAGLFAGGPLSAASLRSETGDLKVAYERFARNGASSTMKLEVQPTSRQEAVLRLNGALLDAFKIDGVRPRPAEERPDRDGILLTFDRQQDQPFSVHLSLRAQSAGPVASTVQLDDQAPLRFTQFVYP